MKVQCPEQLAPLLTPIASVHPDPDNPRTGHDVEGIARAFQEFGWDQPIVARKDSGAVIKGHGRLAAAHRLKLEQVPVVFVDDDQETALRRMVSDNKLGEHSDWDIEKLYDLDLDLLDLGWSEVALKELDTTMNELSILADFGDVLGGEDEPDEEPPIKRDAVVSVMLFVKESRIIERAINVQIAKSGGTRGEALAAICHRWQKEAQ